MKIFILFVFVITIVNFTKANGQQRIVANKINYKSAVGINVSDQFGFNFKYFKTQTIALEFILSSSINDGGVTVTGLYQKQKLIKNAKGLHWFYGGGVHITTYKNNVNINGPSLVPKKRNTIAGLNGIIGLEYLIPKSPLVLAGFAMPFIGGINDNSYLNTGVALRYILK